MGGGVERRRRFSFARSLGKFTCGQAGPKRKTGQTPSVQPAFIQKRDGGAEGDRTPDLRNAIATLSQLSYGPAPARL